MLLILCAVTYSYALYKNHTTNTFDSGQQKHVYNGRLSATMVLTTHSLWAHFAAMEQISMIIA